MSFSDSFCHFLSQHKGASAEGSASDRERKCTAGRQDGSHYVTINPQLLHKTLRKKPLYFFISANTYEKYIVCKDYCIAHHDDKTCFLSSCKYHILLLGDVEELLKKLDSFCFTDQHVDCLYTLFKYRFSGKVIAKSGQVFDNVQRAVDFNQRNKGVDRMPIIAKKRLLRKKYKKHLLSSFQKTKSTQTSGSVFAERIEKVKKTNIELDLIKIVDCFLDGHGNYDSNLVSFKIKSL